MAEVFISYKRESRALIEPIVSALSELGVSVWFDADLSAGERFARIIHAQLKQAKAVIVCWSSDATDSDWVTGEADYALESGAYVPIFIESCVLMPPYNRIQTVDLSKWKGERNDPTWIGLVNRIAKLIGREAVAAAAAATAKGDERSRYDFARLYPDEPAARAILNSAGARHREQFEWQMAEAKSIAERTEDAGERAALDALLKTEAQAFELWLADERGGVSKPPVPDPRELVVQGEDERRELLFLVELMKRDSGCVLVVGPRVAIGGNDPNPKPLDETLAGELCPETASPSERPANLREAAELHYRFFNHRTRLELAVQDFYARTARLTSDFHRNLAKLPFRLCISLSPDSLMLNALKEAGKRPQIASYNHHRYKRAELPRLVGATVESPLVYFLFGHYSDPKSLVLTESDLQDRLVTVINGDPPIPDEVRTILKDHSTTFLFLGLGAEIWNLSLLFKVLDVHGRRDPPCAYEDHEFFENPDNRRTIRFFSGDRRITFRSFRREVFARRLLKIYENSLDKEGTPVPIPAAGSPVPISAAASAPLAFVSYVSEDHDIVEVLVDRLKKRGVEIWQDRQKLRDGDNWNRVLGVVIGKKVDYVIIVQTQAMIQAIVGAFHQEIKVARARQAQMGSFEGAQLSFIIPVAIGQSNSLASLQEFRTIDVSEPQGVDLLAQTILADWAKRTKVSAAAS